MDIIKTILGFIFGGSKWPLIGLSVLFLGVGGYLYYQMNEANKKIVIYTQNEEVYKNNQEKLLEALAKKNLSLSREKQLRLLADGSKDNLIKDMQKYMAENEKLKNKLAVVTAKKALANPSDFETKVNATMQAINNCFEHLSQTPLTGQENETIVCSVDSIPDFSK